MSTTLIIDPQTDSITLIQGTDVKHETIYSSQRNGFEWSEFIETLGNKLLEYPEYSSWSSGPWTLTSSPKEIEKGEIVNGKKIILENRATYTKTTDECVHVFLSGDTFIVKVDSVSMEGKQSLLINDNDPDEVFNLGELLTAVAKLLRQSNIIVSGAWEAQFSFDEKEWEYKVQLRAAVMPDFMEKNTDFYEPSHKEKQDKSTTSSMRIIPSDTLGSDTQQKSKELSDREKRNREINSFGCAYAILGFFAGLMFSATACSPEPEQIETVVTETVTPTPTTVTTTKMTIKTKTPLPPPPPPPEPEPIEQVIEEPAPIANLVPDPAPAPAPVQPAPPPEPVAPVQSVYYANCAAARAAGASPLYAGSPGYRSQLDRDGDGVACE